MLALTSTLNKLIKRLEEKQSPELVKKHRKRKVVPRKPPPSFRPAGESCHPGSQVPCLYPSAGMCRKVTCSFPPEVLTLFPVSETLFSFLPSSPHLHPFAWLPPVHPLESSFQSMSVLFLMASICTVLSTFTDTWWVISRS